MLSKFLINKGITHVFGYVGGANLPLINQFVNSHLKFIVNRNEQWYRSCCFRLYAAFFQKTRNNSYYFRSLE